MLTSLGEYVWQLLCALGAVGAAAGVLKWHKPLVAAVKWVVRILCAFFAGLVAPFKFQRILHDLSSRLTLLSDDIGFIKSELKTNGGSSIKDAVNRMEMERQHDFWCKPYPAFRMNSKGCIIAASQAYLELVKSTCDTDLKGLGWLQFLDNVDHSDQFYQRMIQSLSALSNFTGHQNIAASDGEVAGRWIVKIFPIGTHAGDTLFTGALYPADEVAKDIAKKHNWVGRN